MGAPTVSITQQTLGNLILFLWYWSRRGDLNFWIIVQTWLQSTIDLPGSLRLLLVDILGGNFLFFLLFFWQAV
jgi:hypothetical protein